MFLTIQQLYNSGYKFDNAVICANGVARGRYCSLSRNIIRLYHGSPVKSFTPKFGLGEDKHDYGRGFYTTQNVELAKEWAKINNG